VWFAFATSFGMIAAGYLIAPDFMANIEFIQFGRVRPIHVNLVLFGLSPPVCWPRPCISCPRLLRTQLYSQRLGVVTAILWNLMLVGVSSAWAWATARAVNTPSCPGRWT
jgi:cytochrome c oxidase cbb3-type subunit 1